MSNEPKAGRGGLALRVKVLLLFAALIATAGSLLAWWDYLQLEAAALAEANAVVARGAAAVQSDLAASFNVTKAQLYVLRTTDIVVDRTRWAAPPDAGILSAMLRGTDGVSAVYVGYPDGRFILARPLDTPEDREQYDAPHNARYLVQWVGTAHRAGEYIYLNGNAREIARTARPDYRYDPRTRPWFSAARGEDAAQTPVYRFSTSHLLGYTIVLRAPNGAVAAEDVDLGRLSARLNAALPTPGSAEAIIDAGDAIVAASSRATSLAPLLDAAYSRPEPVLTDAGGQRWHTFVATIGSSARGPRKLVVVVPERDLLVAANRVRNETLLAGAVLLLLWMPAIWWIAGLIARPLQDLQREAATLLALDFHDPPAHRSVVVEVARLADAFGAVRRRLRRYLALNGQLASERDLSRILNTMVGEIVDACNARGGALALRENGTTTARAGSEDDVPASVWDTDGLAGRAIATRLPAQGPIDASGTEGLAVPLRSRTGGVWGAAIVTRPPGERRPFSPSSRAYAEALADSAAIAIEAQATIASLETYRAAAKRFVPTEFAGQLGRDDIRALRLGDHVSRRMIVMFVHLHGVKAAAIKAGPDTGFKILETFFGKAGPIVRGHGGFVDKYVGDMAMALFPYRPDAAAGSAVEILRELKDDCRNWTREFDTHFKVVAGLHGGGLMLGTIGEERRFETTVIADVVNVASRISGLTHLLGTPLLVSGDIATELQIDRRRRLAECAVKGARRPIFIEEIYSGDDEELAAAKDASAARFDAGRRLFAAGDIAAAGAIFADIAAAEPRDFPAAFFRDRCAAGVDADWNGIVRFTTK